ncbi:UNVERIFIED_CONTAM: hypothetical protein Cloal_3614 [Acetivibrio alkalicellulosi]
MEYLLVDGYNVINSWKDEFDLDKDTLEECRDKLLNIMSNYQGYKKINVIVVFDAYMVKGGKRKKEIFDKLKIIYTEENQTADNYIERFVYKNSKENIIRVVTSDYLEQKTVLNSGGIRMSPRELKEEIALTGKSIKEAAPDIIKKSNSIMSNVNHDLLQELEKMRRGR